MAKNETMAQYNEESIKALKGAERIRTRPASLLGSDGIDGCQHAFFEILANAVDEAREGYGKEITVTVFSDGVYEVEDRGRGIPLGYNKKEDRYNWELIFCELYAGAKYDNNNSSGTYEYSLGLNGVGACATQYTSEFMTVRSYNGKTLSVKNFEKGESVGELEVTELTKKEARTGTIIRWKPDYEVFTDTNISKDYFTNVLEKQSVVNAGVKFVLHYQNDDGSFEDTEYYYENGIVDHLSKLAEGKMLIEPVFWSFETSGRDREDRQDYKLKSEITFVFTEQDAVKSGEKPLLEYYHNSSYLTHGGSPAEAVRSAFVYSIDKYLKSNSLYGKNDKKIQFEDITDSLILITNSFSTLSSYENQTKKGVTNPFVREAMDDYIRRNLEIYFIENPINAKKIAARVLTNKNAREEAAKRREDAKSRPASVTINIANRVEKYVDCRSKDPEIRELYIVEGDSAATSVKLGRNAEFQAIMPVRGKTLNCLKSAYSKIFASPIITDLLKVIGCGVEFTERVKTDLPPFDLANLRWNKIIICTDADEDGYQIRTLILTMFYRLLPTLIRENKIYIAESPLFEINHKDDTYFAYNEQEKIDILSKLGDVKVKIQRSKGLGENQPDMMWQTTMNPETRRLINVAESDSDETWRIFNTLLGDDLQGRKDYIAEHGAEYIAMAID